MDYAGRHFPNALKKHRKLMGYTQNQVANKLGYKNASIISIWENSEVIPSYINVLKLSILYRTLPFELYPRLYKEIRKDLSELDSPSREAATVHEILKRGDGNVGPRNAKNIAAKSYSRTKHRYQTNGVSSRT